MTERRDGGGPKLEEHDAMICRACGNEERASEGYPCTSCGTFICVICSLRGIQHCRECAARLGEPLPTPPTPRAV